MLKINNINCTDTFTVMSCCFMWVLFLLDFLLNLSFLLPWRLLMPANRSQLVVFMPCLEPWCSHWSLSFPPCSSHSSLKESVASYGAGEMLNHLSPSSNPCRMRCLPLLWVGGSVKPNLSLDGMFRWYAVWNGFGGMIRMG